MLRPRHWLLAAMLCVPAASVCAQTTRPTEVSPKDWAYQAVESLAARGLVHGYKDAKFLDGRKMTRFEMASLVKRLIDSMLDIPVPKDKDKIVSEAPGTAASRGQGVEPPPTGRTLKSGKLAREAAFVEGDLPTVRRLADEYSVELAVMGVDLQDVMDKLGDLEGRVEAIESSLRDPEGPLQTVIANVARIDKIRFSGYIQARYESFENTHEKASPANAGVAVTDRFTLRRVRLNVAARPTEKIGARWQFDGSDAALATRDAYIEYFFTGNSATGHTATIGQMKVPFGFEVVQSSSVREAPERARISRFFFPGERDRGFKIASRTGGKWFYEVGVFNGSIPGRTGQNAVDNNNDKDIVARVRRSFGRRLDVGASINLGVGLRTALAGGEGPRGPVAAPTPPSAANPYENTKIVYGVDFQWFPLDNLVLRGEAMVGKANGVHAAGYIAQAIYNVDKKNQLVAKYDWFGVDDFVLSPVGAGGTPVGDAVGYTGTLSNLALGVVHHLDSSTRLKLFYEIHGIGRRDMPGVAAPGDRVPWQGNILRFEVITLF